MNFKKTNDWMRANARPIDLAKWDHVFHGGNKEAILAELLKYQSPDGGFGNGLEPDIAMPGSSAMVTAEALFIAYEYDLDFSGWCKPLLAYLETSVTDGLFWEPVPREVEDFPHAPW